MGANSRNKGAVGEREFAKVMGGLLGCELKRNLNQPREGGHDLDDGSQLLSKWVIEVKRCKEKRLSEWWKQATEQVYDPDKAPLLAYRIDRHPWRLVIHISDIPGLSDREYLMRVESSLDETVEMSPEAFVSLLRAAS